MEAWTSGRVSRHAREAWLEQRGDGYRDRFIEIQDGYRFIGWESEIAMARAMGRGWASGAGLEVHRFDRQETGS